VFDCYERTMNELAGKTLQDQTQLDSDISNHTGNVVADHTKLDEDLATDRSALSGTAGQAPTLAEAEAGEAEAEQGAITPFY